jgi:GNAT superfamily N-acetyltransferase
MNKTIVDRPYQDQDYDSVTRFLGKLLKQAPSQHNWLPGRFEYAEYLVAPLFTERGQRSWKETIHLWEHENEIVAMVNSENPDANTYIQVDPSYTELTEALVAWAEENLPVVDYDNEKPRLMIWVGKDDQHRQTILSDRGFQLCEDRDYLQRQSIPEDVQSPELPQGYSIASFGDELDFSDRMSCAARAFGDEEPLSESVYKVTRKAPNYRSDLDIGIVDENKKTIALCTVWLDVKNDLGYIEPVATDPEYHRKGFGHLVLKEAMYRMRKAGVSRAFVGAHDGVRPFYKAAGFVEAAVNQPWEKWY